MLASGASVLVSTALNLTEGRVSETFNHGSACRLLDSLLEREQRALPTSSLTAASRQKCSRNGVTEVVWEEIKLWIRRRGGEPVSPERHSTKLLEERGLRVSSQPNTASLGADRVRPLCSDVEQTKGRSNLSQRGGPP